jgi:ABC-type dipeptide/oligopeptide/nickel transport system permease subunit
MPLNSLIPMLTLAGLSLPRILGGALVVESLFDIQGMGWVEIYPAGLASIVVVVAFKLIGDGLRDSFPVRPVATLKSTSRRGLRAYRPCYR